jgi:hypothetical protein
MKRGRTEGGRYLSGAIGAGSPGMAEMAGTVPALGLV